MNWNKIKLYGGLILAMCFWAYGFIWYKVAFNHLEPMTVVFLRLIVASICVSLLLLLTGKFEKIRRKDFKLFALLIFLEPFLFFIGESFGMQKVSPTMGSIIVSFIPLLTPILAFWLFKENLSWFNYTGIILSFVGVLFVLIGKGFIFNAPLDGIALMFLAVICAIGYSGVVYFLAKKYKPLTIIFIQSVFGSILFLPLFLIFDLKESLQIQWSWAVIEPVIKLGVFPSVLSFLFYNIAIREIGINRSNVFTNFIPVVTAILSFTILGEDMPFNKIFGIILVIAGLTISQRKKQSTLL